MNSGVVSTFPSPRGVATTATRLGGETGAQALKRPAATTQMGKVALKADLSERCLGECGIMGTEEGRMLYREGVRMKA